MQLLNKNKSTQNEALLYNIVFEPAGSYYETIIT